MENSLYKNDISIRLVDAARRAWERGAEFRTRRDRYKKFTYGDQWSDLVAMPDGSTATARLQALKHGKEPMTNNLIRRMVKCVIGRFRMWIEENAGHRTDAAVTSQGALEEAYIDNSLDEMDCRALEEFLISGVAVQRVAESGLPGRKGPRVVNVNPTRLFVNSFSDPRGDDIEMIGMLHDMSPGEAVMRFAHGSRGRARELRELFGRLNEDYGDSIAPTPHLATGSFNRCPENGRCRVIEVWTLESRESVRWLDRATGACGVERAGGAAWIDRENSSRASKGIELIDNVLTHTTTWRCRWLAPDGTVLDEYDTPYGHGTHPFVVKMYPLTDGEVHSLVEDVIDQQIYINRLITLMEKVMSSAAKGVLLFPKGQKSTDMGWEKIASIWASPDGVIPYEGYEGLPEPKQLITNGGDYGARDLLSLQLKMIEDVSGVSNALLGRSSSGGNVGYERYESEVRNATVAINDLLLTFVHFRRERDRKILGAGER